MPRNKYPEETEKKILDASLKLFLEKGYEETTVLDIVAQLNGLTRGAFYHHFKSKEAVFERLVDMFEVGESALAEAMLADMPSGLERLRFAMKGSLVANTAQDETVKFLTMLMVLMTTPYFFAARHRWNLETAKLFEPMIEEGMADGSIRKGNAKVLSELLMLLVNHWAFPNIFPCTREEFSAKAAYIEEILNTVGLPVIDDEMRELFFETINKIDRNGDAPSA
ncbi:MAG: TetR/AcrR family transcriptional regulator [Defluviitaleaceae bacterium]|nr:TetR/AcrR family transcriptional regulator [Defluviitaleaceae bacterium]